MVYTKYMKDLDLFFMCLKFVMDGKKVWDDFLLVDLQLFQATPAF